MNDWSKKILGEEWEITPAGGLTGDAYIAEKENRRLFLKRNSSPFLAVLSAEGIVPKLVWTKRMENGDVITAQEWLEGRTLKSEEMQNKQVTNLLRKIHYSSELLHMLMRLGKKPVSMKTRYMEIKKRMENTKLADKRIIQQSLIYLSRILPVIPEGNQVVCHGDINHHNFLMTKDDQIYLIDWDNAMIADPMTDYGMVLNWYIPKQEWNNWLATYGVEKDKQFMERLYCYLLIDALFYLVWHYERNEEQKVFDRLNDLTKLMEHVNNFIPY